MDILNKIIKGDCIEEMKKMEDNSVDTIITDPPYGLSFMGKKWDYDVPSTELWKEALRVLKPGGTALIFAGSRTQHRMAVNIEDAGFILKDTIMWLYGSGFPKATDISKQLDKGVERKVVGYDKNSAPDLRDVGAMSKEATGIDKLSFGQNPRPAERKQVEITEATTPEAKVWNGWKSHGLKPAYEPILEDTQGRFPANIILDSEKYGEWTRFFYVAKASKAERNAGCEGLENVKFTAGNYSQSPVCKDCDKTLNGTNNHTECSGEVYYREMDSKQTHNNHPTVKPIALMEYLVTLTSTPTGGIVLDPFAGSGTTLVACKKLGRTFIGIEKEEEYCKIAEARLNVITQIRLL